MDELALLPFGQLSNDDPLELVALPSYRFFPRRSLSRGSSARPPFSLLDESFSRRFSLRRRGLLGASRSLEEGEEAEDEEEGEEDRLRERGMLR